MALRSSWHGMQDGVELGHLAPRWGWGQQQGSVSGKCLLWDDDDLHASVYKDQKRVERSLLHSGHVESIYLLLETLHENKSQSCRMLSGSASSSVTGAHSLLLRQQSGASH